MLKKIILLIMSSGLLYASQDTPKNLKTQLLDAVVPVKPVQDIIWGYLSGWTPSRVIEGGLRSDRLFGVKMAFTADGKYIAIQVDKAGIALTDVQTEKTEKKNMPQGCETIISDELLFSRDGQYLVVKTDNRNSTAFLDAKTYLYAGMVESKGWWSLRSPISFSSDGSYLVVQEKKDLRKLTLFDAKQIFSNRLLPASETTLQLSMARHVRSAHGSWDGKYLLVIYDDYQSEILTRTKIYEFSKLMAADWSREGYLAVSVLGSCNIIFLKIGVKGSPVKMIGDHDADICHLIWSIDSKSIIALSLDSVMKIWDVKTGNCMLELKDVLRMSYSPRGYQLALLLRDHRIQLLDNAALELEWQAAERAKKTAAAEQAAQSSSCVIS